MAEQLLGNTNQQAGSEAGWFDVVRQSEDGKTVTIQPYGTDYLFDVPTTSGFACIDEQVQGEQPNE